MNYTPGTHGGADETPPQSQTPQQDTNEQFRIKMDEKFGQVPHEPLPGELSDSQFVQEMENRYGDGNVGTQHPVEGQRASLSGSTGHVAVRTGFNRENMAMERPRARPQAPAHDSYDIESNLMPVEMQSAQPTREELRARIDQYVHSQHVLGKEDQDRLQAKHKERVMYEHNVIDDDDDDKVRDAPSEPYVGGSLPRDDSSYGAQGPSSASSSAPPPPPPQPEPLHRRRGPQWREWKERSAHFYDDLKQRAAETKARARARHAARRHSATSPTTAKPTAKERVRGLTDATTVKLDEKMGDAKRAMEKGKATMRRMREEAKEQKAKHREEGVEPEAHRDEGEVKKDLQYAKGKLREKALVVRETVREMVGEFRRKDGAEPEAERSLNEPAESVH